MLRKALNFARAALEDRLTDDTISTFELVDAVHVLFLCHAELADARSFDPAHQRRWQCLVSCERYAVCTSERNHAEVGKP